MKYLTQDGIDMEDILIIQKKLYFLLLKQIKKETLFLDMTLQLLKADRHLKKNIMLYVIWLPNYLKEKIFPIHMNNLMKYQLSHIFKEYGNIIDNMSFKIVLKNQCSQEVFHNKMLMISKSLLTLLKHRL